MEVCRAGVRCAALTACVVTEPNINQQLSIAASVVGLENASCGPSLVITDQWSADQSMIDLDD